MNLFSEKFSNIFTTYSEKFNNENFESISIGDDRNKVDILLGKPIYLSKDNVNQDSTKLNYWYSKNLFFGLSYNKVVVQFYEDKVVNKIRVVDSD